MSEYRPLATGDVFPASFLRALQEFIGATYANYQLTLANSTTVQIVAGTGDAQVGLGIDGLWRYVSTTVNAAVTGAAGLYDVWAVTGPNRFSNVPTPDTDNTDYTFALQVLPHGSVPNITTTVTNYRGIGQLNWDGAAITGLTSFDGNGNHVSAWQPGDLKTSVAKSSPGWLLCDGSAVSQASFPALFAAIGTTWNTGGEASGQFRLPTFQNRAIIGAGTTVGGLGTYGGTDQVALTAGNIPAHTHTFSGTTAGQSNTHTHHVGASGTTLGQSNTHSHTTDTGAGNFTSHGSGHPAQAILAAGSSFQVESTSIGNALSDHTHAFSISVTADGASADHSHSFSGTTGSSGSSTPIDNKPLFATANVFIKT